MTRKTLKGLLAICFFSTMILLGYTITMQRSLSKLVLGYASTPAQQLGPRPLTDWLQGETLGLPGDKLLRLGKKGDPFATPLTMVVAFSTEGCNLCLADTMNLLNQVENQGGGVGALALAYGPHEALKGKTRGLYAEHPNLPFWLLDDKVPASWDALHHPHLLMVGQEGRILLDRELDVARAQELEDTLAWLGKVLGL